MAYFSQRHSLLAGYRDLARMAGDRYAELDEAPTAPLAGAVDQEVAA
ncbi:hypothetical protein [Thiocystis violacea]|nr:hypothetical protein [Thiocystis violacea]